MQIYVILLSNMASLDEKILLFAKNSLMSSLGKRIQNLREEQGLSQVDLAAKMLGKFDTTNISRIESGRTNPTILTLYRIAKALDVQLKDLVDIDVSH